MWISDQWQDFELIDCSGGEKLERWGSYTVVRPDPQAIWQTPRNRNEWNRQGGHYKRSSTGGGKWDRGNLPSDWTIGYKDLTFQVKPMNFKHMGLFPEQATNWDWAMEQIRNAGREISVLNLFAYTGAATVACLKAGASVCHVDAAKGMVAWAKQRSLGFRVSDGQCSVGGSSVRFNQHLDHGSQSVGFDLYVGEHLHETVRFRCLRQPGTGSSGNGIRPGTALWMQLPVAACDLKESISYERDHTNGKSASPIHG